MEQQYGSNDILDLSDASIQLKLEQIKEQIKKEIRKELKIKEGAENMRKVTTDKKSMTNVNNMVKQANTRLQELQQELNELNARIVVTTENAGADSRASGKFLFIQNLIFFFIFFLFFFLFFIIIIIFIFFIFFLVWVKNYLLPNFALSCTALTLHAFILSYIHVHMCTLMSNY